MASKEITLPDIGEGVTEGELVKWLVASGDSVEEDQPLAEVMTDKATVEVPSPTAGTVGELKANEGDVIPVGGALCSLEAGGVSAAEKASPQETSKAEETAEEKPKQEAVTQDSQSVSSGGETKEITLPDIGEGVTEGELVKWLVASGDSVEEDQPLAEVMTDKATVEVPSPTAGTVGELKANEGDVIPVGGALCSLQAQGGAASKSTTQAASGNGSNGSSKNGVQKAPVASTNPPAMSASSSGGGMDVYPPAAESSVLATPSTRRLAREMGIDINGLKGTGNAGRVTREDVLKSKGSAGGATTSQARSGGAPKPAYRGPEGAVEERVALRGIRKKIAENMQMYKHIIPHFTLMDEANVTDLVEMRSGLKKKAEQSGVKVTYLPFIIKALIATLREFPEVNASIDDDAQEIVYKKYFNIGFAADTPNGLLVPVIKNADQKSILELSREIVELAGKARDGKLALDEMKGATITITNIGSVGGTYATPIINHPEVAILGVYKMTDKPILSDGQIDFIKSMNFTVTADHRLIDGAVAARFLSAFIERIENPGVLMLDLM